MSTPLTGAQREAIRDLLERHGPGASYTAERDEDHDSFVFVAIYGADRALQTERIIESDGSYEHDAADDAGCGCRGNDDRASSSGCCAACAAQ